MERVESLSRLLRRTLLGPDGQPVGRLSDVIIRLRGRDYPMVTGLVAGFGRREVFVPVERIESLDADELRLTDRVEGASAFERREGEVLLRADVLGHRVIDVEDVELVRAHDLRLRRRADGWVVDGLDVRPHHHHLFGLIKSEQAPSWRDWKSFEPLIGHTRSARVRGPFGRLGRLKPADLADLLEDATRTESREILQSVHADPELEADVFEELEPDSQIRLLRAKSDEEIAEVVGRMRADDAADAINDLPQDRRRPVLEALPAGQRTKVMTLMGFNPSSAGGMMALDFLTAPPSARVADVLTMVCEARSMQAEALTSVHCVEEEDRLIGTATVVALLQVGRDSLLREVMVTEPVRVLPDTDIEDVALLMTDYNLLTVPVVDERDRVLGVITVDDILEAVIPEDWRRREPGPHPIRRGEQPGTGEPTHAQDSGG